MGARLWSVLTGASGPAGAVAAGFGTSAGRTWGALGPDIGRGVRRACCRGLSAASPGRPGAGLAAPSGGPEAGRGWLNGWGPAGAARGAAEAEGRGASAEASLVCGCSAGAGTGTTAVLKSNGRSTTGCGVCKAGASAPASGVCAVPARGAAAAVVSGSVRASRPSSGRSSSGGAAASGAAGGAADPAAVAAGPTVAGAGRGGPAGSPWGLTGASGWSLWTGAFGPLLRTGLLVGGASVGLADAGGLTSCPIRPANSPAAASGPLTSSRSATGRSKTASRADGVAVAMETSSPVHPDGFPAPGLCRVR